MLGMAPAPVAVVGQRSLLFAERRFKTAFDGPHPLPRHVRTWVRSPQTNGVIERWFGDLKYEHLFRGVITDGNAVDMEVHRFRIIYNTIRPHQALGDRTPSAADTACDQQNRSMSGRSGRSEAWRFSAHYHPRGRPRPWQPACR
jgi:hypothetical protein